MRQTFEGHKKGVKCCCIATDNKFIISGSNDNSIRIWNLEGECLRVTENAHASESGIFTLCIAHDNSYFITGAKDHDLRIWNTHEGNEISQEPF